MITLERFENIPQELQDIPHWVLWRREKIEGRDKLTKVPFQTNARKAASTIPDTWTNFPSVVSAYQAGKYDGVGFSLTEETPIGIDLDHCRCPAFHDIEIILPWAQDIIKRVASYTEASPSGQGIRIFVKGGKLPEGGRHKKLPQYGGTNCGKDAVPAFEIYESGRYLTVTGNHIAGTPKEIMARPEAVAAIHKEIFGTTRDKGAEKKTPPGAFMNVGELIEKAFNSKNGDQIRALYSGDYSAYPSQSEADLALCSHLAFWLDKDAVAIDVAFRASGLFRPKWDKKHHSDGSTYGQRTIEKAIEGCRETYTGGGDRAQETQSESWSEPLPLPEGLPPVKALDPAMIPTPFRSWIMDIADRMQIPPDFSAAAAIVAAGSVIGRGCGIYPKRRDDWIIVPNLWGGVVGRPSLMKSPAVSEAQRPLIRLEIEARDDYQAAAESFENEKDINKIKRSTITKTLKKAMEKKDDEAIVSQSAELFGLRLDAPTRRRYQTQDGTTEKIGELLNENTRGLLINRDELIGWFRSLDRDGREGDRAFYLEGWNGNKGFAYDRIGRGTIDITALCVSIFGTITPGPLAKYVYQATRGGSGDDGLLQRFQLFVYPDAPSEWKNVDRFPDTVEKNRAWEIFKALSGDIPGAVQDDGQDIPCLRFSPGGQDVFDQWRDDLEKRLRGDHGLHSAMESHLTKYRKLMPALALIFHCIELADNTAWGAVSETAAIMAATWCDYLESHAARIYRAGTMPGMESAREIVKHIKRGAIQDKSSLRDIYKNHWSHLDTLEDVKSGLEVLEAHDWLIIENRQTGGRPTQIIMLNPHLKK